MNWFGNSFPALELPRPARPLVLGLVNNFSDRGLKVGERQFRNLLQTACPDAAIELRLFTCPEIPRAHGTGAGPAAAYASAADIFETELDGLIVTGMEPQARNLRDEPVWGTLSRLADWAEDRAIPVIWSCLAAHAALLYLDGIPRTRHAEKISGIFDCEAVSDHPLATGLPRHWGGAHSRYHGVSEQLLAANGYRILSRAEGVGADIFLKERGASFLFFQGHPEYEADTLVHEYKRDVRRYLVGERDEYPGIPLNCFDPGTQGQVERVREEILAGDRDLARLQDLCSLVNDLAYPSPWRPAATRLVANWLVLVAQRETRPMPLTPSAAFHGELSL